MILSPVSRLAFLSCQLDLMGWELMGIEPSQATALMSVPMCLSSPFLSFVPPTFSHMHMPDRNVQIETASPPPSAP